MSIRERQNLQNTNKLIMCFLPNGMFLSNDTLLSKVASISNGRLQINSEQVPARCSIVVRNLLATHSHAGRYSFVVHMLLTTHSHSAHYAFVVRILIATDSSFAENHLISYQSMSFNPIYNE